MNVRDRIVALENTGMSTVEAVMQAGREEHAEFAAADLPVVRQSDGFIKVGTSEDDAPPAYFSRVSGSTLISMPDSPRNMVIHRPNGRPLVTIDFDDGHITFGEDYTPEGAAKIFWEAISNFCPKNGI